MPGSPLGSFSAVFGAHQRTGRVERLTRVVCLEMMEYGYFSGLANTERLYGPVEPYHISGRATHM